MATVLVKCSNGHRFPVNLNKHQDRNYRFCPRCLTKVKVRNRLGKFLPNPTWQKQKEEAEAYRQRVKAMKGKTPSGPAIALQGLPESLLALSLLLKKQAEEEKKKQ